MKNPENMARWAHGEWTVLPTFPITAVTQDSRKAGLGTLLIALRGPNHDGHDFVAGAFRAGATAAMVCRDWTPPPEVKGLPLLRVDDTAQALRDLAAGYRHALRGKTKFFGITGSAGKTTLKELLAAICSGAGTVSATIGNLNNDIGLPLSVLNTDREAKFSVIEAGISHPHDMDPLAEILRPDAAAVSCIGPAHIEYFGSETAIAAEKAKLLAAVPAAGFTVIPLETTAFDTLKAACRCRVITVSLHRPEADWTGEMLSDGTLRVHHGNEPAVLLETPLCGEHNASNMLVAYATAREAGITATQALAGLKNFRPPAMRWETVPLGNVTAINDAYNANPLSMRAALDTFAGTELKGDKVVCIGDMLELGDDTDLRHRNVGKAAGNGPWRLLAGIGPAARSLLDGAVEAGYPRSKTVWYPTTATAADELPLLLKSGDTVLLKASRGMHLEQLLDPMKRL